MTVRPRISIGRRGDGAGAGQRRAGRHRRRGLVPPRPGARRWRGGRGAGGGATGEKDAKLAQKLGQLQPFAAVFPQECTGQLASFGPT
jgi:hypothetical protein